MSVTISENEFVSKKASIISPGIEFIGVINNKGRLRESIGQDLPLPEDRREMFFMKVALRNSMQKDFDEQLGGVSYCITQRGDRKFISVPTRGSSVIFVATKDNVDHQKIVDDIYHTIQHSEIFLGERL